jgi:hypothetical protein
MHATAPGNIHKGKGGVRGEKGCTSCHTKAVSWHTRGQDDRKVSEMGLWTCTVRTTW